MTENELYSAMRQYPAVSSFLHKIADRYDRRGDLKGTLKLGQNLTLHTELDPLLQLFGLALKTTQASSVNIDFNRFFAKASPQQINAWVETLFKVIERTPANTFKNRQLLKTIFDRMQLAYPHYAVVYEQFYQQKAYWLRRMNEESAEAVQEELLRIGQIIDFLHANTIPLGWSELGARFCNDSKALRATELTKLVGNALLILEGNIGSFNQELRKQAFNACHIIDNPTAIKVAVYGPVTYLKKETHISWIEDLWQFNEAAVLTLENLHNLELLPIPETITRVITIENETPFCRLKEEVKDAIIIYTEGYPNEAVLTFYEHLPSHLTYLHWGDTDFDGLLIAGLLDHIHPLDLWRCGLDDINPLKGRLIPLSEQNQGRAQEYLNKHLDFKFTNELLFAITNGWLEQENWG